MATHRLSKTRLHHIWRNIKQRCYNPNEWCYKHYGGRGIKVCEEWKNNFMAFHDWAIANGYDENAEFGKCTIDRIDGNGDYSPENCRWVDFKMQQRNKCNSVLITYHGQTKNLIDWASELEMPISTIWRRLKIYPNNMELVMHKGSLKGMSEVKRRPYTKGYKTLTYNGETKMIAEWSKATGIPKGTIISRIEANRPIEEIFYKGNLRYKEK